MNENHTAASLGIKEIEASDGFAVCEMLVTEQHLNRLGVGHGGVLFTLADSAMAIASNAGPGTAVASQASISYLAAAALGDQLVAVASHVGGTGKSRIFDATVKNQDGKLLALFRGTTVTIAT